MDYLLGGRAWGKTHAAVGLVKNTPGAVLVVHAEGERERIIRDYGMDRDQVWTYSTARSTGRRGNFDKRLVIDNFDMLLAREFANPVLAVTGPAGRIVMVGADMKNTAPGFQRGEYHAIVTGSTPGMSPRDRSGASEGLLLYERAEALAKARMMERERDEERGRRITAEDSLRHYKELHANQARTIMAFDVERERWRLEIHERDEEVGTLRTEVSERTQVRDSWHEQYTQMRALYVNEQEGRIIVEQQLAEARRQISELEGTLYRIGEEVKQADESTDQHGEFNPGVSTP